MPPSVGQSENLCLGIATNINARQPDANTHRTSLAVSSDAETSRTFEAARLRPLFLASALESRPQHRVTADGRALHDDEVGALQMPDQPLEDRPLFGFAGLWTPWRGVRGPKSAPVEGKHELFGFLTTEANSVVAPIHPKAMPVILTTTEESPLVGGRDGRGAETSAAVAGGDAGHLWRSPHSHNDAIM